MGRSIHEIPRQDLLSQESRNTPETVQNTRPITEGSISQVGRIRLLSFKINMGVIPEAISEW